MTKRLAFVGLAAILLFGAGGIALALDTWAGTGEIVDMHCYKKNQAKGDGHAGCAKKCLDGADAEMGLLQADGTVVKLAQGDPEVFNVAKGFAGKQAKITGTNNGGVVTVETAEAAK
jgi:hypothetical protein